MRRSASKSLASYALVPAALVLAATMAAPPALRADADAAILSGSVLERDETSAGPVLRRIPFCQPRPLPVAARVSF